jgi:hypothetical protein
LADITDALDIDIDDFDRSFFSPFAGELEVFNELEV